MVQACVPRATRLLATDSADPMKKNYVLDTNVLLHDPHAIFRFEDNNVIIPIYVIEEVDQFKREGSERGRNARSIARVLDELREKGGSLSRGVTLDSGGTLRVAVPSKRLELPSAIDHTAMDQAILQTAFDVRENDGGRPTVFVTMDTNLRIRADAPGMVAETYENQRVDVEQLASGMIEVDVDGEEVDAFFRDGRMTPREGASAWPANTCLAPPRSHQSTRTPRSAASTPAKRAIVGLRVPRDGVIGACVPETRSRASRSICCSDESIRLVTLGGQGAGPGKHTSRARGQLRPERAPWRTASTRASSSRDRSCRWGATSGFSRETSTRS